MEVTYISDPSVFSLDNCDDKELVEALKETNNKFGNRYFIRQRQVQTNKWYEKREYQTLYTVYVHLHSIEYQILNIGKTRNSVLSYLYGMLTAYDILKAVQSGSDLEKFIELHSEDISNQKVIWTGDNLEEVTELIGWSPYDLEGWTFEQYKEKVAKDGLKVSNEHRQWVVDIGSVIRVRPNGEVFTTFN